MNNSSEQKQSVSTSDIGILMVLLGAVFSGLRPLFGRWLINDDVTAVIIALYTFIASTVIFLPGGFREIQNVHQYRSVAVIAFSSGLFVGIGGMAYFEALQRLPVATVTLVYFTYPAMVITVVTLLRRRWPQPSALLAIVCVLIGCGLIVGPKLQGTDSLIIDFAIAFITPLSWTLLLLLLAGPLIVLNPWSRIGLISNGATFAMIVVVIVWQPPTFMPRTMIGWLGVLGLVVVSGIFTHILWIIGIPKAGPERASIAGVFEVATALAVGWVVFLEPITLSQCVGVFLIGTALILTRRLEVNISSTRP